MERKTFKRYRTELVNGSKGTINLPEGKNLQDYIENHKFIRDSMSENVIRSSAIVKFEYVGTTKKMISVR